MDNVVILGIGNIILKDDGVGIHIIRELEKCKLPDNILLVDGGTSTIDMLSYFIDYKKIIIIDALRSGLDPGTVYKIKPEDIKNCQNNNLSIHDVQILDVVKIANLMGANPEVIIFGIEPLEIKYDLELSEPIKAIIPDIIKFIKYELHSKITTNDKIN